MMNGFTLHRVPKQPKQPLRAWDAADELVLAHIADIGVESGATVLVVNDSFGALACGLHHLDPAVVNESAAGREATATNLSANDLDSIEMYSMLDLASGPLVTPFDVVIIKIPKSNSHLVDLLHRLRPLLHDETRVIGAAMVKHLRNSTLDTFSSLIGPTTTSLAKKKARLVFADVDVELVVGENPWPVEWTAHKGRLTNHGGGFSPNSLDIGTAALLDGVDDFAALLSDDVGPEVNAVDLGCGNGIVGLRLVRDLNAGEYDGCISAIDDSALAIDATERSWAASTTGALQLVTHHHHRMVEVLDPGSTDIVVVNPPFHNDRVIGDHTAWSMFTDAHRVLRKGAPLVVVGNRHLAYHAKLKKIFGNVETISSSAKFVVLLARR